MRVRPQPPIELRVGVIDDEAPRRAQHKTRLIESVRAQMACAKGSLLGHRAAVISCGVTLRSLTFEQYSSGVPCPGCDRPYVDAEPFDFEGTLNLSDVDRLRSDTLIACRRSLTGCD